MAFLLEASHCHKVYLLPNKTLFFKRPAQEPQIAAIVETPQKMSSSLRFFCGIVQIRHSQVYFSFAENLPRFPFKTSLLVKFPHRHQHPAGRSGLLFLSSPVHISRTSSVFRQLRPSLLSHVQAQNYH